jgi:D-glycero-D-manno-heptose 1,7-bisphosphate phosphatase
VDLVILDRDGVINHDSPDFIKSPEEWRAITGSLEAIAALSAAGIRVAIATNQSGIGRGLFSQEDLDAIHLRMTGAIEAVGGRIDMIVVCPHAPRANCDCRKPRIGLFRQIAEQFGLTLPLEGVPCIGDSSRDIEAARDAGARPILVLTGNGAEAAANMDEDNSPEIFATLSDAVLMLLGKDIR